MAELSLPYLIDEAARRMQTLRQQASALKRSIDEPNADMTVEELQTALEELQVASDELRAQNEALIEAQQRLDDEQRRYLDLFHSAPEAYFVTDRYGIIRDANAAAFRLTGVDDRFVRGKPIANCVAPHDRDRIRAFLNELRSTNGTMSRQLDFQPRSSEVVPVEVSAAVAPSRAGYPPDIRWIVRDISAARRAERERLSLVREQAARVEAERSLALMEQIFADIADPFFALDRDGRIVVMNGRCAMFWAVERDDCIGKTLADVLPGAQTSEFCVRIAQAAGDRFPIRFETASPVVGLWAEVNAYPVANGVAVYFRDISALKRRQEAVRFEHERDRHIADVLQRSLIASAETAQTDSLDVGHAYASAREDALVGGDYLDMIPLPGRGALALVVGDVAGKGLEAAAHIAQVKYALRLMLWEDGDLSGALKRLNDFMCSRAVNHFEYTKLVALNIAIVDQATLAMDIASAGGEPPVILRSDGTIVHCDCLGMMIGVEPEQDYQAAQTQLESGDALLLCTDGLTEAHRSAGELFGVDRAVAAAREMDADADATQIAEHILARAREHAAGALHDDVCVLYVRRR